MYQKVDMMLRFFDIIFSVIGLIFFGPLILLVALAGLFDTGMPLFFQQRVGRHQHPFTLVKFRTMKRDTLSVASHLADPEAITPFGQFLRRTKIDELPQFWNVLKGEMSLVGPRPCLPSQVELIVARVCRGVFDVRPGVTGLAQIDGIDMSDPERLAEIDARMVASMNVAVYLRCLFFTLLGRGSGDQIRTR